MKLFTWCYSFHGVGSYLWSSSRMVMFYSTLPPSYLGWWFAVAFVALMGHWSQHWWYTACNLYLPCPLFLRCCNIGSLTTMCASIACDKLLPPLVTHTTSRKELLGCFTLPYLSSGSNVTRVAPLILVVLMRICWSGLTTWCYGHTITTWRSISGRHYPAAEIMRP